MSPPARWRGPPHAATDDDDARRTPARRPLRVRMGLQLLDADRQQRFLLSAAKPPVYLNGTTYPAEQRQGPDDGSYFIFNDENQSEKGGITVSSNGAQISFDYPSVQGLTMNTIYFGKLGAAQLSMQEMPDPDIPVEELRPEDVPQRVLLGCSNAGDGSLLFLYDSEGRPRITLHVDGDDVPRIRILDADGNVVAALPPEDPAGRARGLGGGDGRVARPPPAGARPGLSRLPLARRAAPLRGRRRRDVEQAVLHRETSPRPPGCGDRSCRRCARRERCTVRAERTAQPASGSEPRPMGTLARMPAATTNPDVLPLGAPPRRHPAGGRRRRVPRLGARRRARPRARRRRRARAHPRRRRRPRGPRRHPRRRGLRLPARRRSDAGLPDPASRHQPRGLRGPSRIVDAEGVRLDRRRLPPRPLNEHVIYELHVGTFTPEGTFDAAIDYLPGLAELGVTAIEVMPIAEFPGNHGWGYDGVYLSAAQSSYGGPQGFRGSSTPPTPAA